MKLTGIIPEHILKRMNPDDRAPLGKAGLTASEASEVYALKSERDLQKLIRNELLRREIPHSWSRMDKKSTNTIGWPDFTFPIKGARGRMGFIEVKFASGKTSDEQLKLHGRLRSHFAVGIVASEFGSVKEFLDYYEASEEEREEKFMEQFKKTRKAN